MTNVTEKCSYRQISRSVPRVNFSIWYGTGLKIIFQKFDRLVFFCQFTISEVLYGVQSLDESTLFLKFHDDCRAAAQRGISNRQPVNY